MTRPRPNPRVIHLHHGPGTVEVTGLVYDDEAFSPYAEPMPYCLVKFDDGDVLRFRGWQNTSELEDLPPQWDLRSPTERFAHDNSKAIQDIQEHRP